MRIKHQLLIGNGTILGIFIAVTIVIVVSINSLITNSQWVTHTHNVIGTANQIMASMVDQETGIRGYMATGDEGFLEPYHGGKKHFSQLISKAKNLVSDNPGQVERFKKVETLAAEWDSKVVSEYFSLRKSVNEGHDAQQALLDFLASGIGKAKMDLFRTSWNKVYKRATSVEQINLCWGILLDMVNMETGMRGYLVTGKEVYLEPFEAGSSSIDARFAKLRRTNLKGVANLQKQALDWINHAGKTTISMQREAISFQRPKAVTELMGKKLGKQYMDTIRAVIAEIIQEEQQLLVVREDAADKTSTFATMSAIGGVSAAVLFAVLIVLYILRSIMQQLGKDPVDLVAVTNKVTAGDFSIDDGSPQIGVYGQIVSMVATLKEKIETAQQAETDAEKALHKAEKAVLEVEKGKAEIEENTSTMLLVADEATGIADRVASSSEELSTQITQVSKGAEIQKQRVLETVTAMEEMNSTVLEIARNASNASNSAIEAKDKAEKGEEIVSEVVSIIGKVNASSISLQKNMQVLDEQAEAIGSVMNVINDIADQTNLLALNAAIEAARAGEAGRGFAVVADEVRKLAERTMDATGEVGSTINAIQQAATLNISSMQEAATHVSSATDLAEKSGKSLHEIVGLVESSASQIAEIATASQQQATTSEEINKALDAVSTVVNETTAGTTQSSHSVNDLAKIASELTRTMTKLK